MKIYVASSWRNQEQPFLVRNLRELGHEVYDFRNPPHGNGGFSWSSIDANWMNWTPDQWRAALGHPLALDGFKADFEGMQWADMCVCLLPCGRSAHLEAGWFVGKGKPTFFFAQTPVEPDLMVLLGNGIVTSMVELDNAIHHFSVNQDSKPRVTATESELHAALAAMVAFFDSVRPGGPVLESDPNICYIRAILNKVNHNCSSPRAASADPDLLALLEKLVGDVRDIHDIESIRYDDVLAAQAALRKAKQK